MVVVISAASVNKVNPPMAFAQNPQGYERVPDVLGEYQVLYIYISLIRGRKIQFVLKCVLVINLNWHCAFKFKSESINYMSIQAHDWYSSVVFRLAT